MSNLEYKLEYDDENPKMVHIRLLGGQHINTLVLLGELKLTNNEVGELDDNSLIEDFTYKILDSDFVYDDEQLDDLTIRLSEVLCDIVGTEMV